MWWCRPVVPAMQEAQRGGSLEGWGCCEQWSQKCTSAWATVWEPVSNKQTNNVCSKNIQQSCFPKERNPSELCLLRVVHGTLLLWYRFLACPGQLECGDCGRAPGHSYVPISESYHLRDQVLHYVAPSPLSNLSESLATGVLNFGVYHNYMASTSRDWNSVILG